MAQLPVHSGKIDRVPKTQYLGKWLEIFVQLERGGGEVRYTSKFLRRISG